MTALSILKAQYHHIIYCLIIIGIASFAYHLFTRPPAEIIKTLTKVVTQIQTVEKVVTKDKIVYVDRTIVTKKADGDVVTETDHEHDITEVHKDVASQATTQAKTTSTETEKFLSRYSLEAFLPFPSLSNFGSPNPLDTQVVVGVRVFDTPIFLEAGSNARLNQAIVGLRIEF